ncbi:protein mono-ADP-ribosyltransferase PARP4 isoform X2 [Diabrotica virgifera virgifera]|uniref:AXH domain-containing protein n=1 Tax=Diabrotica virgifera virgifera TaxID=50390 RepID=A0ABM5L5D8_DIAVI|nr:protein mono-ADP-ribosyltransferase PARP4 isoform X2 [Diabrotica virgifera virgifera]XP_050517649.1 protein mono-ADP-ribosyltransferase PARP4 isoform X2 [Diabrotica virgifera virgifera]
MISAGVEGRLPYMTYPEPWRGPPKQPSELFLRPAPKPLPPTTRYNGVTTTYPNGTRLAPPPRPVSKYPSPPATITAPVNLVQSKEEITEDMSPYSTYRMFPPTPQYTHFPYPNLCQPPYLQMRTSFATTPLSPLDTYSPTTPTVTASFLTPPNSYSPPTSIKPVSTSLRPTTPSGLKSATIVRDLREKKTPPLQTQVINAQNLNSQNSSFKVPSGKEGSLKHRILIRPDEVSPRGGPLDLQKSIEGRKRLLATAANTTATMSPPRSPRKPPLNNNTITGSFAKGSLIQLHSGEMRRIEDLRTEDFILSAAKSAEVKLAESTVVKIEDNQQLGNTTITLTYNNRRDQVGIESTLEQPYFVMGQGWASCSPERTQRLFGLKVHKLQVGDVLISLTPRDKTPSISRTGTGTTIMTTATTTSMTARQQQQHPVCTVTKTQIPVTKVAVQTVQTQPMNLHLPSNYPPQPLSPDSLAARKRRWSAPDQICDEEEQNSARRHRIG